MSLVVDDDVADIDADAELRSRSLGGTPALRSAIARCTSTAQRTASTTLANSTSTPSPVVLTMRPRCSAILRIDQLARQAFSARERAVLVGAHQPAVADDIGGQDRREPPLDPLLGHKRVSIREFESSLWSGLGLSPLSSEVMRQN